MDTDRIYRGKYLKYKQKYLDLKIQKGGTCTVSVDGNEIRLSATCNALKIFGSDENIHKVFTGSFNIVRDRVRDSASGKIRLMFETPAAADASFNNDVTQKYLKEQHIIRYSGVNTSEIIKGISELKLEHTLIQKHDKLEPVIQHIENYILIPQSMFDLRNSIVKIIRDNTPEDIITEIIVHKNKTYINYISNSNALYSLIKSADKLASAGYDVVINTNLLINMLIKGNQETTETTGATEATGETIGATEATGAPKATGAPRAPRVPILLKPIEPTGPSEFTALAASVASALEPSRLGTPRRLIQLDRPVAASILELLPLPSAPASALAPLASLPSASASALAPLASLPSASASALAQSASASALASLAPDTREKPHGRRQRSRPLAPSTSASALVPSTPAPAKKSLEPWGDML